MNGIESQASSGTGTDSPATYESGLKKYDDMDYYLGTSPFLGDDNVGKYFKGDMGKLIMWDRCLTQKEIQESFTKSVEGAVLDYDFSHDKLLKDNTNNDNNGLVIDCTKIEETIKVPYTITPHRTPGRMDCLEHPDEGFHEGNWIKGETTARNEERFIMQMQQGKIKYKEEGLNSLKYTLVSVDELTPNAKMINVIL